MVLRFFQGYLLKVLHVKVTYTMGETGDPLLLRGPGGSIGPYAGNRYILGTSRRLIMSLGDSGVLLLRLSSSSSFLLMTPIVFSTGILVNSADTS